MFTTNTLEDVAYQSIDIQVLQATANKIIRGSVYTTSSAWLAVQLICSILLLVAGVASIIWDVQSISPDVLGFASGIARRSKYVDPPKNDTAATGPERARLLGQVLVMMQDVKPDAPVGRVALGTARAKVERLQPGRMYR